MNEIKLVMWREIKKTSDGMNDYYSPGAAHYEINGEPVEVDTFNQVNALVLEITHLNEQLYQLTGVRL